MLYENFVYKSFVNLKIVYEYVGKTLKIYLLQNLPTNFSPPSR